MRFAVLTTLFIFLSAVCAYPVPAHVKARHNNEAILKRGPSASSQGSTGSDHLSKRGPDLPMIWDNLNNARNQPLELGAVGSETVFTLPGNIYISRYSPTTQDAYALDAVHKEVQDYAQKHGRTIIDYDYPYMSGERYTYYTFSKTKT